MEADISRVLNDAKNPMRASEIARALDVPRSRVNAVLHANIGRLFVKNEEDFTWTSAASSRRVEPSASRDDEIQVEAHFAPDGRPIEALCAVLDDAREEILVQAYYLRSEPVADALIRAHKRGVVVRVLLGCTSTTSRSTRDPEVRHGGRKHATPTRLNDAGIQVYEDCADQSNNHNKCAVVDGRITITGGLNFCDYAAHNADNLVVIRSRAVADQFRKDWQANHRNCGARFQQDVG